jgi:hypothetical protein
MAGLKEAFRNAAAAAFAAADDIKEVAVLRSKTNSNPNYDPVTDTVSDAYTDYTVDILPSGYNSREVDGQTVLITDEKAKILVTDISVDPKRNDQIVRDSVKWEIINVHKDAADAVWTLQIRRP